MDNTLYALELAGHCNETTAWKFLKDVSEALRANPTVPVNPTVIEIKDDGSFALATQAASLSLEGFDAPESLQGNRSEASAVWSLAASLFYLVMGCQVMNGKGGVGQSESSKLPYMRSTLPLLSELVQRCLQYKPEFRPNLDEVNKLATRQYGLCMEALKRGPKFQEKSLDQEKQGSLESQSMEFWPEAMQPEKKQ